MIIDLILDRKDGVYYNVGKFYRDVVAYGDDSISRALDSGTEEDVKNALCDYIISQGYKKSICNYINNVRWLESDMSDKGLNLKLEMSTDALNKMFDDADFVETIKSNSYVRSIVLKTLNDYIDGIQDFIDEIEDNVEKQK